MLHKDEDIVTNEVSTVCWLLNVGWVNVSVNGTAALVSGVSNKLLSNLVTPIQPRQGLTLTQDDRKKTETTITDRSFKEHMSATNNGIYM